MNTITELDLGIQKIKKMGPNHYIRIPKALVDAGAIPMDSEYRVKVVVKGKEIIIEEKTESEAETSA